jgi:hypothetical protein
MAQPFLIPPAGVSAAGFFDPYVVDTSSPPAQLADDIDSRTGDIRSMFAPTNPVHAAVQFNLSLAHGSGPATNGRGQKFAKIRKIGPSTEQEIRLEIERILQPLVDAKLVGDVTISTQVPNPANRNQADWVLDYRELLTGQTHQVRR